MEEQRAYTTLGRAHLLHGQGLADTSASDAMTQLKQAEKAFLKSLLLTKEYVYNLINTFTYEINITKYVDCIFCFLD